jgi:hypothetical protein
LYEPWISSFLGFSLGILEQYKARQDIFLYLFKEKNPKGEFTLSLGTKIIRYFILKKEDQS